MEVVTMKQYNVYCTSHHPPNLSYNDFKKCEYILSFQEDMLAKRLFDLLKQLPFQKKVLQHLWGYYLRGHSSVSLTTHEIYILELLEEYIELYLFHYLDEYLPLILSEISYNYTFEPLIVSKKKEKVKSI